MLQFSLRRLWETRPRDEQGKPLDLINEEQFKALPDVQRALGTVANGIFATFSQRQRDICERLMQELVVLDENFEAPLRRRRHRAELRAVLVSRFPGRSRTSTRSNRFIEAGLLRAFGGSDGAQVEVTHEALLRHWDRINQVVSGEDAKRRLHAIKQIAREASEWRAYRRSEDRLKQLGKPLAAALDYVADGWIADEESVAYLQACKQRERTAIRQANRLFQFKSGLMVVSVVVVLGLLSWIGYYRLHARATQANLEAVASLSESLPPWDALDLTYTLAAERGAEFRVALAHALERAESIWLGDRRDVSLLPSDDGSALLQRDPEQFEVRIYRVDNRRGCSTSLLSRSLRSTPKNLVGSSRGAARPRHRVWSASRTPLDRARSRQRFRARVPHRGLPSRRCVRQSDRLLFLPAPTSC